MEVPIDLYCLGDSVGDMIEKHFENALKILNEKENLKIAGLLILKQQMTEAPSFTFSKLFLTNRSSQAAIEKLINVIRSKKYEIRKIGLSFLEQCLEYMAERDSFIKFNLSLQ